LIILVQHVPFHLAANQRFQGFLEVILVLARKFEGLHQVLDFDAMPFLGRQHVIGVSQQYVPCPALQQRDIVLDLDGGTVLDDLSFW
jgi:hypothetical protein